MKQKSVLPEFKQLNYEYDYRDFPSAYLITLRTYGTWLHGDEESSVQRRGFNVYETPRRGENEKLKSFMSRELKSPPFLLDEDQRKKVNEAIAEVCKHRKYELQAINARSNHVHIVVSAQAKPKLIAEAFKSYSTRRLREESLVAADIKIWAREKSRRYLWKPHHVALAVEYVLYGQGDIIPDITDCPEFDD